MNLALRLKELREKNNLTQVQFAKIFNIGAATIGMWESTQRKPPSDMLQKIADHFGVTVDYLLGREENKIPPAPVEQTGIEGGYLHIAKEFQGMGLSEKDLKALMDMAKLLEEKNKEIK